MGLDPAPQASIPPQPFLSLKAAADFVQAQRAHRGRGLPASFYVPSDVSFGDATRELITRDGVGTYDTALAVIILIEAGRLEEARQILSIYDAGIYWAGTGAPMSLRAYPNPLNAHAFEPLDAQIFYLFDFTTLSGDWTRWRDEWKFWNAHTGPNAWMVNALLRYVWAAKRQGHDEKSLRRFITLAQRLGQAMRRLQDVDARGGVRYGPQGQFHDEDHADPFLEINTENNLSAYSAFQMLYQATGDPAYQESAAKILSWLRELYDQTDGTLLMGEVWNGKKWVRQKLHATDSGGTWAISVLGPEKIDALWGEKAAYRMWQGVRARAGRTATFGWVRSGGDLAGLDFCDVFPESESLISPEWTAGGLFALRTLITFYSSQAGQGRLTTAEMEGLKKDQWTMAKFLSLHSNSYAFGPGFGGARQGRTGFGWFSPPLGVQAMASAYAGLYTGGASDPAAWWRSHP